MRIERIAHKEFTSNTYRMTKASFRGAFFVDMGIWLPEWDTDPVEALFLTHAHYDHIYAIERALSINPSMKVYAHPYTLEALGHKKLNLSFYHDLPVECAPRNQHPLIGGEGVIPSGIGEVHWWHTPGHNEGSVCFGIGDYFFSGDSFIPGHPVVTKLKSGSRRDAYNALLTIQNVMHRYRFLSPGHCEMLQMESALIEIDSQLRSFI